MLVSLAVPVGLFGPFGTWVDVCDAVGISLGEAVELGTETWSVGVGVAVSACSNSCLDTTNLAASRFIVTISGDPIPIAPRNRIWAALINSGVVKSPVKVYDCVVSSSAGGLFSS